MSANPLAAFEILPQPDDSTCGPTCLHAIYRAHGDPIDLAAVITEVESLPRGGTLAVRLGCHALRRGYAAAIYTYNLALFDPTWFGARAPDLAERLRAQAAAKSDRLLRSATADYLRFLELGGRVRFEELSGRLIRRFLQRRRPILVGLSATYLYGCAREAGDTEIDYDDVRGDPMGHFVVLYGWDPRSRRVHVADPYGENPAFERHHYAVSTERLIGAILLGVLTYDANLLVLEPRAAASGESGRGR